MAKSVWFCCAIAPVLLAACGSRSFTVQQRPKESFKQFGQVVVEPFGVDGVDKLGLEEKPKALKAAELMTQCLKERLEGKAWFKEGGKPLTIKGLLVGYDPGSQAMRYLVGFGAGKGEIVLDTTFADESGEVIARGASKGSVSGGLFGGSTSSACDRVAKAIIDFINANYETVEAAP